MYKYCGLIVLVAASVLASGCASTKVTSQQRLNYSLLPRPGHIWVYNFAATASQVPADSEVAMETDDQTVQQTAEQIQLGQELGAQLASQLAADIQEMRLPADVATPASSVQINDLLIRGYLVAIEQGGSVRRMVVGFGAGGSQLETAVEVYQMTAQGPRMLGTGTIAASGNKTPGAMVPAAVTAATGNPIGLIIVGGIKVAGEVTGSSGVEGRAKATAQEIAAQLKPKFQAQGWIS